MSARNLLLTCLIPALLLDAVDAPAATRRFLLAAGANSGGPDRVALRYAVTDARSFASIMVGMGGVRADDRVVLSQPDWTELESALEILERRIAELPAGEDRAEIVFYYSGHADERGQPGPGCRGGTGRRHRGAAERRDDVPGGPGSVRRDLRRSRGDAAVV